MAFAIHVATSLSRGEELESNKGYKIVLTTDRTLMSEYSGHIFLGFSACVPRGLIPDRVYFSLFCPSVKVNGDGSLIYAPYGTRKIEASLMKYGFKKEDIIVAHPSYLNKVVGPNTRVIGITEQDPLGIGPATSTFKSLFGGEAYMTVKFRELLNNSSLKKYKPKIIVGGPGTWQLENLEIQKRLGLDCVVVGEGEKVAGLLFKKAVNGEELPRIVYGDVVSEDEVPTIERPSIQGIVEVARGCGRGCDFCVPTMLRLRCFSIEHILREVEVNLRGGKQPLLHAEDILRYKSRGLEINREAVVDLFRRVKNHSGVKSVNISHFALSSVLSAPEVIEEISSILDLGKEGRWLGGQTGIETGSPRLIRENMMGKCRPFMPEEWPEVVVRSFKLLTENHWVPCGTLIFGLPSEEEEDVDMTIELIEGLKPYKSLIVPLFLTSMGSLKDKARSFTLQDMTPLHTELLLKCWEHNFDWLPTLLKDSSKNLTKPGLSLIFSYGVGRCRQLFQKCRNEYNYDIQRMIRDMRNEKSTPIRHILDIRH